MTVISLLLVVMISIIKYYTIWLFIMVFIPQFIWHLSLYKGICDIFALFNCVPILIYGGKCIISRINRKFYTKALKVNSSTYLNTKIFIEEHNNFCKLMNYFNIFWSKIYLQLIIHGIPISLLLIHQFLFEKLLIHIFIFYGLIITFYVNIRVRYSV